jgi:hypothetical protein
LPGSAAADVYGLAAEVDAVRTVDRLVLVAAAVAIAVGVGRRERASEDGASRKAADDAWAPAAAPAAPTAAAPAPVEAAAMPVPKPAIAASDVVAVAPTSSATNDAATTFGNAGRMMFSSIPWVGFGIAAARAKFRRSFSSLVRQASTFLPPTGPMPRGILERQSRSWRSSPKIGESAWE